MTTDTAPQTVLFPDLFAKPLFAKFNQVGLFTALWIAVAGGGPSRPGGAR